MTPPPAACLAPRSPADPLLPALLVALLAAACAGLFVPTWVQLAQTLWSTDEQSHGPFVLLASLWLLWRRRRALAAAVPAPRPRLGWLLLLPSLALYVLGRSQDILMAEVASPIGVSAALLLMLHGRAALTAAAFPLLFLFFMVPLPEALVAAVTGPLKAAVSAVAAALLHAAGVPVGRSGVLLTVGPYQLLVADACAGLSSMFTLEALGLLYMHLKGYTDRLRKAVLALLLVPTAFAANVVRVLVLVGVTLHWGDAAGQGFVHGFAGLLLFAVALALMVLLDRGLGLLLPAARQAAR